MTVWKLGLSCRTAASRDFFQSLFGIFPTSWVTFLPENWRISPAGCI